MASFYLVCKYYMPGISDVLLIGCGLFLWLAVSGVAYFFGHQVIISASDALPFRKEMHPQLFNIVEEMKIAAGLPHMPKIYIMNEKGMNAMAVGRNPENSSIIVTAGLLARLNRDELQGVVAHEMSHILNRDNLFMTFAGVTLCTVTIISDSFWRSLRVTGGGTPRMRFKASRLGGVGAIAFFLLLVVFSIVGTITATLLYFSISRKREYLADATAVRLTRYPEGLASALEKISKCAYPILAVDKVTAPMFISNPYGYGEPTSRYFNTHPPVEDRIKVLRKLSHGVSYNDYEDAYSFITQDKRRLIPESELKKDTKMEITPSKTEKSSVPDDKDSQRRLTNLMMAANNYLFYNCACGMTIKIPPELTKKSISCPRCKKSIQFNDSNPIITSAEKGLSPAVD